MFPSASPRGTLRVSGKQNSLFPLGPVIKCLMFLFCSVLDDDRILDLKSTMTTSTKKSPQIVNFAPSEVFRDYSILFTSHNMSEKMA